MCLSEKVEINKRDRSLVISSDDKLLSGVMLDTICGGQVRPRDPLKSGGEATGRATADIGNLAGQGTSIAEMIEAQETLHRAISGILMLISSPSLFNNND